MTTWDVWTVRKRHVTIWYFFINTFLFAKTLRKLTGFQNNINLGSTERGSIYHRGRKLTRTHLACSTYCKCTSPQSQRSDSGVHFCSVSFALWSLRPRCFPLKVFHRKLNDLTCQFYHHRISLFKCLILLQNYHRRKKQHLTTPSHWLINQ